MGSETLESIPIKDILIDETFNCRGKISFSDVADLAKDIENTGLIQPVVVRTFQEGEETFGHKYALVAGFRRTKAVKHLDQPNIKAIVHNDLSKQDAEFVNFSENLNRVDLNIMQEAETLIHLIGQINPSTGKPYNEFELGAKIGKSRGWVQTRLMLLKLPKKAHDLARGGYLNASGIRQMFSYKDPDELAKEIGRLVDKSMNMDSPQALKVRATSKGKKDPAATPKQRRRKEINAVLDYFGMQGMPDEDFFKGLKRGLAWAAGNISDLELLNDIRTESKYAEVDFEVPDEGFVRIIEES